MSSLKSSSSSKAFAKKLETKTKSGKDVRAVHDGRECVSSKETCVNRSVINDDTTGFPPIYSQRCEEALSVFLGTQSGSLEVHEDHGQQILVEEKRELHFANNVLELGVISRCKNEGPNKLSLEIPPLLSVTYLTG